MDYLQYYRNWCFKYRYRRSFKPCYKWITFNITDNISKNNTEILVLNLVINGLPSIYMQSISPIGDTKDLMF